MARKCFYSFHFKPDNWRAGTVRSIGSIEGNEPVADNEWEAITSGSDQDEKIKNWIADQMKGKSCTVLLVGAETANRKWINHEIVETWNKGLGIVGIRIHGLKNKDGYIASIGENPFEYITHTPTKKKLSEIVRCYNPTGADSKERYAWISQHLENAVEEAIKIRGEY